MHRKVPVRFGPGVAGKGPAPQVPRRAAYRCLRAGRHRAGGAAGDRVAGQEPDGPAEDGQAGCDVAGPADPGGCAATFVPRPRSGRCGISPGPGPAWSTSGPGSCSGWRSCSKTPWSRSPQVVSDGMKAKSAVAMVAALVAGERDPRAIADLAKGSLRGKRDALAEALDGMFGSHRGVIAQALLDQVAFLDQRITRDQRPGAIAALAQVEQSWGVDADGESGPGRGPAPDSRVLAAVYRLAEIPGVSVWLAIVIIAEIGLNMALFPTPAHLVSPGWGCAGPRPSPAPGAARASRRTATATPAPPPGRPPSARPARPPSSASGMPASPAAGGAIAQVAVARSIMIIVWHLLADPAARYRDLGPDWHAAHVNRDKKIRNHIRGLQALGLTVTVADGEHAA